MLVLHGFSKPQFWLNEFAELSFPLKDLCSSQKGKTSFIPMLFILNTLGMLNNAVTQDNFMDYMENLHHYKDHLQCS